MGAIEVLVFLLGAVAVLAALGERSHVPPPIVLVLGGLAIAFVPGLPAPQIDPDVVLFVFLPPLLYFASFTASAYELRDDAVPIGLLAVPLVLVTMGAVAAVAHWIAGIPWAVAFVLGAVLGPTDPVSATAILQRLGAPTRLTTILEGEALVNDGTALTAYGIALGAVGAGSIAAGSAVLEFVGVAAGGIAVGLVAGWLFGRLRQALEDPSIDVTLSLITPYAAYIPAERIGVSGVLATVTAGLYIGTRSLGGVGPESRLRTRTFWEAFAFLLESLLFLLIGLQLPSIVGRIEGGDLLGLIAQSALLAGVVMGVRLAWMYVVPSAVTAIAPFQHRHTGLRERAVLGWSGMRGAVSLAAALAIPITVASGERFPHRDLVIVLAYGVVLLTLVIPGVTLGPLLRRLGLGQGEELRRADAEARARITNAALERLTEIAQQERLNDRAVERLRDRYQARLNRLESSLDHDRDGGDVEAEQHDAARLQRAMLDAEREALDEMARERAHPAEVLERLQGEVDLDESRLRARAR
jgi:Na+/H+ antiporter